MIRKFFCQPNSPSRGICVTAALNSSVNSTWCVRGPRVAARISSMVSNSFGACARVSGCPAGGVSRTHNARRMIHTSTNSGIPSFSAITAALPATSMTTNNAVSKASTASTKKIYA